MGAATELHAAGVPISSIMALGRWTSAAAVIYILGCLETTIEASSRLGSAQVQYVRGELRRASEPLKSWMVERPDGTSIEDWLKHCAAVDSENS